MPEQDPLISLKQQTEADLKKAAALLQRQIQQLHERIRGLNAIVRQQGSAIRMLTQTVTNQGNELRNVLSKFRR